MPTATSIGNRFRSECVWFETQPRPEFRLIETARRIVPIARRISAYWAPTLEEFAVGGDYTNALKRRVAGAAIDQAGDIDWLSAATLLPNKHSWPNASTQR